MQRAASTETNSLRFTHIQALRASPSALIREETTRNTNGQSTPENHIPHLKIPQNLTRCVSNRILFANAARASRPPLSFVDSTEMQFTVALPLCGTALTIVCSLRRRRVPGSPCEWSSIALNIIQGLTELYSQHRCVHEPNERPF